MASGCTTHSLDCHYKPVIDWCCIDNVSACQTCSSHTVTHFSAHPHGFRKQASLQLAW